MTDVSGTRQSDVDVLEAAATWYVQLQEAPHDALRRQAWQQWLEHSPEHRKAWEKLQTLEQRLGVFPKDLIIPTLAGAEKGRRSAIKTLVMLASIAPAAWIGYRELPWREWRAEVRTATGEQRKITLADGSSVRLNTATALDTDFTSQQRLITLIGGEILVETVKDMQQRPFLIRTQHGTIQALGTRFMVRVWNDRTQVSVLEHAVAIQPKNIPQTPSRLEFGQRLSFFDDRVGATQPLDDNSDAWTRGMLVALDWRLDRFINELSRYHFGYLSYDPAIGSLRLSGAFRLDDIDGSLDNLAAILPVQVKTLTSHWIRILPR